MPTRLMDSKAHWENVYRTRRSDEVSWFQPMLKVSLELIRRVAPEKTTRLIDVGGGASSLIDALIADGYSQVTVLDVSSAALTQAQTRLGMNSSKAHWLEADVLAAELPADGFDVWHDRAVFHFMTEPSQRAAYAAQARRAVRPGGFVLIATFAENGPTSCSGLPVARYSARALHAEFGESFQLIESVREVHRTPAGMLQPFVYCLCQRANASAGVHAA